MSGLMDFSYAVDGKTKKVSTTRNIWTETLLDKTASSASLELKNTGKSTLFARLVAEGIPAEGKEKPMRTVLRSPSAIWIMTAIR